jgi:hypothetical protein
MVDCMHLSTLQCHAFQANTVSSLPPEVTPISLEKVSLASTSKVEYKLFIPSSWLIHESPQTLNETRTTFDKL